MEKDSQRVLHFSHYIASFLVHRMDLSFLFFVFFCSQKIAYRILIYTYYLSLFDLLVGDCGLKSRHLNTKNLKIMKYCVSMGAYS